MKLPLLFCLLFLSTSLFAQVNESIIYPQKSFLNQSPDTLFYLPKQKLETIMEREVLNNELIDALENRVELCDSALLLKSLEAENWYTKLLETDTRLLDAEIKNARQQRRHKLFYKIWFGAGVVLGWVVCVII